MLIQSVAQQASFDTNLPVFPLHVIKLQHEWNTLFFSPFTQTTNVDTSKQTKKRQVHVEIATTLKRPRRGSHTQKQENVSTAFALVDRPNTILKYLKRKHGQ